MSTNSYPVPPPSYGAATPGKPARDAAAQSLLASAGPSSGQAIYDQPDAGDLPDDFKYGTTVAESAPEIQAAFIRKVYTILFLQILGTCIVSAFMRLPSAMLFVQTHPGLLFVPLIGSLVNLFALWWKRHAHPTNLILLSTFTILESLAIGAVVAFYDQMVVMQALLITLGVFIGLTLFTMQSKYNFDGMGPYLFAGLMVLLMSGIVQMFIPFGKTMDLVYGVGGALLFSGYIVYDTHVVNRRLSPDEYIWGAISLYLDFINLFLSILRILQNMQDR